MWFKITTVDPKGNGGSQCYDVLEARREVVGLAQVLEAMETGETFTVERVDAYEVYSSHPTVPSAVICGWCDLRIVPGIGDAAAQWRTADGGKYLCKFAPDALHSPAI